MRMMEFEVGEERHQLEEEAELTRNSALETAPFPTPMYKECLKNHALAVGGHAVDGCGEFIPAGDPGTLEALTCAACNCHRNFHRKWDTSAAAAAAAAAAFPFHRHRQYYGHFGAPMRGRTPLLALPSSSGAGMLVDVNGSSEKKRFRTKFSEDQKERMTNFAEKLGWRIQKHDEEMVQEFCNEIGIKRQVLKVWMHNNKNTLGKK